jgi:hypothetical protein
MCSKGYLVCFNLLLLCFFVLYRPRRAVASPDARVTGRNEVKNSDDQDSDDEDPVKRARGGEREQAAMTSEECTTEVMRTAVFAVAPLGVVAYYDPKIAVTALVVMMVLSAARRIVGVCGGRCSSSI